MTLVTVDAVVDVSPISRMASIGRGLGVARAIRARKNRVIVCIRVASGAHAVGVAVVNVPPAVGKSGTGPRSGVVASSAGRGENGRRSLMDGIRGAVVSGGVAAVAVGGQRGVVVVDVAVRAWNLEVETRERKRSRGVVKRPVGPQSCIVAELASRGESHLDMINRRRRGVVILQVARDAGGVGSRQAVIVVDVAIRADAWRDQV